MATAETPWHAKFPQPTSTASSISPEELARIVLSQVAGKDYIVVDVRRTDFERGFIKGAINLPAHSFYQTLPTILDLFSIIPKVIFHCNSCTPTGRGVRVAGWYKDAVAKIGGNSEAFVLEGGIQAWLKSYEDRDDLTVAL